MKGIELPVSLGEALDKLTILDIKREKIKDERLKDVEYEYGLLYEKLEDYINENIYNYIILKKINLNIWNMQDDFRYNNGDKNHLCLKIIEENDRRFRVKKKINDKANSNIKEQKGYKLKKAFVLSHLGLGDNITALGMVRYLSTLYDEIVVVCKKKHEKNVELFYQDDSSIIVYPVNNDDVISPNKGGNLGKFSKNYSLYLLGGHNLKKNNKYNIKNIPYTFYEQVNINPKYFWEYFYIPTIDGAKELYEEVKNIDYVFIHNTSSSGVVFDIKLVEEKLNLDRNKILFLNPNLNCYKSGDKFFELAQKFIGFKLSYYVEIIKNAQFNIMSDSSFMCLSLNLEIKTDNNYYYSRGIDYSKLYSDKYFVDNLKKRKFKNFNS